MVIRETPRFSAICIWFCPWICCSTIWGIRVSAMSAICNISEHLGVVFYIALYSPILSVKE